MQFFIAVFYIYDVAWSPGLWIIGSVLDAMNGYNLSFIKINLAQHFSGFVSTFK